MPMVIQNKQNQMRKKIYIKNMYEKTKKNKTKHINENAYIKSYFSHVKK